MKILYAIQGTGNGHVSRAREIIPHLKKYGEVDLLISGTQAEIDVDEEVKYRFTGFGFVFGENGGVDFRETWKRFDIRQFIRDCRNLPVKDYDLVINDFEPVAAWACRMKRKKSHALSHQSAMLSTRTPKPGGFHWGGMILRHYAPASTYTAFHFRAYDDFIHTPVIRSEIRILNPQDHGHYTVYLPAYSDHFILEQAAAFPEIRWHIFSKHSDKHYISGNAEVFPVDNQKFTRSLENCCGLLTGGGFEGPAEALFLKKKVLCVPMKNQYEQQCNALALEEMGVPVIWKEHEFAEKLFRFINSDEVTAVDFPDETEDIIASVFSQYGFSPSV